MSDESQPLPTGIEHSESELRPWWQGITAESHAYLVGQFSNAFQGEFEDKIDQGYVRFRTHPITPARERYVSKLLDAYNQIKAIAEARDLVDAVLERAGKPGLVVRQKRAETLMEDHMGVISQEYKIHLQPKPGSIPEALKSLGELYQNDDEAEALTDDFKVILHPSERGGSGTNPAIIIYPQHGHEPARKLLLKVLYKFSGSSNIGVGDIPRYNVKISELLYFAQSGGDLKIALSNIGLLGKYFDEGTNFAFLRGEAQRWRDTFPVEIADCVAWEQLGYVLDTLRFLPNSKGQMYTASEWAEKIAKFRRGDASIESITHTGGLRNKVLELSEKDKPD